MSFTSLIILVWSILELSPPVANVSPSIKRCIGENAGGQRNVLGGVGDGSGAIGGGAFLHLITWSNTSILLAFIGPSLLSSESNNMTQKHIKVFVLNEHYYQEQQQYSWLLFFLIMQLRPNKVKAEV